MTLPNFLIIGSPKAGTTSLSHYLNAHPQIFMSSFKESHFFSSEHYKDSKSLAQFKESFQEVTTEKAIGEACATYIFYGEAYRIIHEVIPYAKLLLVLRDPAERVYSNYLMAYRTGRLDFKVSADDLEGSFLQLVEQQGIHDFYFESLQRYLNYFNRDQLKVFLFEDLKHRPHSLLREAFEFLGVDSDVNIDLTEKVFNQGGVPKNRELFLAMDYAREYSRKFLAKILPMTVYESMRVGYSNIRAMNMRKPPKLSKSSRKKLIEIYREDTLQLQDFLQRDLSAWLTV